MVGQSTDEIRYFQSTEILGATAKLAVGFHRLVVLHSPDPEDCGRIVPLLLDKPSLVLGRIGATDGVFGLRDTSMSRRHAAVELADDGWYLRDLGSRNGCFLNARRTAGARLTHGSVIRVGQSLLLYEAFELADGLDFVEEEPPLWGPSVALQIVRGSLRMAGRHGVPVLLLGDSGVGKEVAAAYLHAFSGRPGPLVPVNCGALPADLMEAELFGAAAGAYTGADTDRIGLFEAASGGTILLDEIGEVPVALQAKLLRVLAEGEIRRVGETVTRSVDVRVVAATNRDLEKEVERGAFRGDLLARLSGWILSIPGLRNRREDVLALARRMWSGGSPLKLTPDAAEVLVLYSWPYNVRELRQVCDALAIRAGREPVGITALPERIQESLGDRLVARSGGVVPLALRVRRDRVPGRDELHETLVHYGGNVSQAARFFDKARFQVYRWCEKHGLDPDSYRPEEPRTSD